MVCKRLIHRKRRPHLSKDEDVIKARPPKIDKDQLGLRILQQQIGNQAVRRLLSQQQGEGKKNKSAKEEPAEIGEVKIEQPEIEYYKVDGNSLPQVSSQVLPPGQWYQYEYQYHPTVEQGQVVQVDIEVKVTLRVPQWAGQGWEQATEADKAGWLQLLQSIKGEPEEFEEGMKLPNQWLLGSQWEQAPDKAQKAWQDHLQTFREQEKSYLDITRRRAMVLQQRLLNQPESMVTTIFDQFMKDLKVEQDLYDQQLKLGQEQKVSLSAEAMLQ